MNLNYVQDYKLNLVNMYDLEHAESCEGQLKYVLKLLQLDQDKRAICEEISGNSEYRNLRPETGKVISVLLGSSKIEEYMKEQYDKEGGSADMCKALEDLEREAKQQGKVEGKIEGKIEGVNSLMQKLGVDMEKACELIGITAEEYSRMEALK
ncbi:MAG: hypothetical protein KH452_13935 [Clostridiales bacterium]|nr:hypothetical protein [Clostridiales bacterium]